MSEYPAESNVISGGYYLNNLVSVARFLMANGYSRAGAAGVAGAIAGESGGNPESVQPGGPGRGLIQWSPESTAKPYTPVVTGNVTADWQHQLTDILNYANNRQGVNLTALKKATDPQEAARLWSQFEAPAVAGSDIRSGVVNQVYSALSATGGPALSVSPIPSNTGNAGTGSTGGGGSDVTNPLTWGGDYIKGMEWAGKWISGVTIAPITSEVQGLSGITGGLAGIAQAVSKMTQLFALLMRPSFWLRIGAFFAGLLVLGTGVYFLKGALT